VPEGKARIRCIMTSEHTREQIDEALETMERVAKRMNLLH
jgi:glycine C-acetyltransferase